MEAIRAATTEEIAAATAASGPDAVGEACREAVDGLPGDPGLVLAFTSGERDWERDAKEMAEAAGGAESAGMTGKGLFGPDGPMDEGCVAIAFGPQVSAGISVAEDASSDLRTAGHACTAEALERSIADLAVSVGRELNLSESAIEDLRYGGIFHDVGKIAIPDALINKPGPLTEDEFEVIKQHPAIGAEILAPVPFLYGVRTIVRHAHEHWDGGGYPEGLSGEQIPLGARIVLAVDAYHAMTSDRPYREAMSHPDAWKELEDNAGTQFDPEVVEALLAVLQRVQGATAGGP